jgi:hypothetical protein
MPSRHESPEDQPPPQFRGLRQLREYLRNPRVRLVVGGAVGAITMLSSLVGIAAYLTGKNYLGVYISKGESLSRSVAGQLMHHGSRVCAIGCLMMRCGKR